MTGSNKDKPNITFTLYLTSDDMDEVERQASIHSKGVKSHHARDCLRRGLEYFRQMEKNKLILEKAQDANETRI